MLNEPVETLTRTPLSQLGAVRVRGADAVRFLQGQVSNDVALLSESRSVLAGLHNPQGRVIALLRLVAVASDDVLAVLPRELAAAVAARLAKYVLRAKAKVTDASPEWEFFGFTAVGDTKNGPPASVGAARRDEQDPGAIAVRLDEERWLTIRPAADAGQVPPAGRASSDAGLGAAADRQRWHLLDIAHGTPQVYAATSEQFVAQMLNLDVVDAISFTKGCYTGQEVVARAHYRGRVKRRMQRFRTVSAARLAPNDTGMFRDGRSFRVVDAAQLDDGGCEFLAVTQIAAGEPDTGADTTAPAPTGSANGPLDAETLTLPYDLPS